MVELIVVVGIIVVLAGILVPAISHAYKHAMRVRIRSDLQVLSHALDAYKLDQRDYPRLDAGSPLDGAVLLCWALYAPGPASADGNDGPGFRIHGTAGTVYGPYVAVGALRLGSVMTGMLDKSTNLPHDWMLSTDDTTTAFVDPYDHPIYYCPARPNGAAGINSPGGLVAKYGYGPQGPMYDQQYFINQAASIASGVVIDIGVMETALGDANQNGFIDGAETATYTGPYLLWAAGPDINHDSSIPLGAAGKNYNDPKSYLTNFIQ